MTDNKLVVAFAIAFAGMLGAAHENTLIGTAVGGMCSAALALVIGNRALQQDKKTKR
ncbi:MAG TPA: hypothetical protein VKG38_15755 [Solirubrobacteraceae bacterium]|nr:hypothetical protein [Solirubrobacteraceae bacterium]HME71150.1 hypothetical protein [Myxococcota bacterium]